MHGRNWRYEKIEPLRSKRIIPLSSPVVEPGGRRRGGNIALDLPVRLAGFSLGRLFRLCFVGVKHRLSLCDFSKKEKEEVRIVFVWLMQTGQQSMLHILVEGDVSSRNGRVRLEHGGRTPRAKLHRL